MLLGYAGFCAAFLRRSGDVHAAAALAPDAPAPVLVAWASQTGFGRLLAERSAAMLREGTQPVSVLPIEAVDAGLLSRTRRALFIAATTGEGDPPDHALAFLRRTMALAPDLAGLEYALLALGDREYHDFCAFGRQLDGWLRARGASALFDRLEVDNADQATLRHWQYEIGRIGGLTDLPDWAPPAYEAWRLQSRIAVNEDGPGTPMFDLALVPDDGRLPAWTAGDIAEIGPRNPPAQVGALLEALDLPASASVATDRGAEPLPLLLSRMQLPDVAAVHGLSAQQLADRLQPLPHREYSIASIPDEGCVRLLIRRMTHPDGAPGLGSGWALRSRRAGRNDRPPPAPQPRLPSATAGTAAGPDRKRHRHRRPAGAPAGAHGGRRTRQLVAVRRTQSGTRQALRRGITPVAGRGLAGTPDLAFSRAARDPAYVQHRLSAAAGPLRQWVDNGASILVCGNATGMAPAIDAVLADILGEERRDALRAAGRYRRDVY